LAIPLAAIAQQPVYLDPSQPIARRVDDLIARLTLEEKTSLLSTTAPAIDRLKIPAMNGWNQSLHGIVWTRPTTMFPVPISMAVTWNPELVQEVAGAIADEGRAIYNYWPTVPGKVEVTGGQGQAVTVTANGARFRHNGLVYRSPVVNQERDRVSSIMGVDERSLREYFLPQFKAGIMEGHAQSIMSSYNGINGIPNAENPFLLKEVLRDEWKFDGFVVPDSGAVENLVSAQRQYKTLE